VPLVNHSLVGLVDDDEGSVVDGHGKSPWVMKGII
jgi:hypothetical protein